MNLTNAVNFIKKSNDKSYEIGIVARDLPGLGGRKKGDVVVFQTHDPSKASEQERMSWGMDHSGDPVTLTVETPYSPEVIEGKRSRGNHIMSHSAMVNVPRGYVKRIEGLTSAL